MTLLVPWKGRSWNSYVVSSMRMKIKRYRRMAMSTNARVCNHKYSVWVMGANRIACQVCGHTVGEKAIPSNTIQVPLTQPGADVNLQELTMDGQVQASGVKKDEGKPRWELVPYDAIEGVVEILTFGAKKYDARNWEKGIAYGRVYGAIMRHLTAWWRGEDRDKESGRSHLDHAMCEIMFLSAFEKRNMVQLDDRPKKDLPF